MANKNDLSTFKSSATAKRAPILNAEKPSKVKPVAGKRGRKAKSKDEKESEMVGLLLTKPEKAKLAKRAGMVPVATFLKHYLRTETDIFD